MPEDPKNAQRLAAAKALAVKLKATRDLAIKMKNAEDAADVAAADAELIIKTEVKK